MESTRYALITKFMFPRLSDDDQICMEFLNKKLKIR